MNREVEKLSNGGLIAEISRKLRQGPSKKKSTNMWVQDMEKEKEISERRLVLEV